jgi:hypothetical protein
LAKDVDKEPLVVLAWPRRGVGLPAADLPDADLDFAHAKLPGCSREGVDK